MKIAFEPPHRLCRWPIVVCLLFGMFGPAAAEEKRGTPTGVLTLVNGGTLAGQFRRSGEPALVRWQGTDFTRPFEFPVGALASIHVPAAKPSVQPEGEFVIELRSGDVLSGRLTGWTDESVSVESPHFGTIALKPDAVRRLYRMTDNPALIYSGPNGLAAWQTRGHAWKEDGKHLWNDQDQSSLTLNAELPDQAVIEFELSWSSEPRFVFAVGVDPMSWPDTRRDGWRFEAWSDPKRQTATSSRTAASRVTLPTAGGRGVVVRQSGPGSEPADSPGESVLAIVRELSDVGTSALVERLTPETNRIHLTAYLDQSARTMQVFHPNGNPAAEIRLPEADSDRNESKAQPGRGVRIINRYGDVRLERLRILRWNGQLPSPLEPGKSRFELADGEVISGEFVRFDADPRRFTVRQEGREVTVDVDELVHVTLPATTESAVADMLDQETDAENDPQDRNDAVRSDAVSPVTVVLQDGTRISGRLEAVRDDALLIRSPDIAEVLPLKQADLRAVSFRNEAALSGSAAQNGPRGRLELGEHQLEGRLIPGTEQPDASCLVWHPQGSRTSSPLRPGTAGRIVYRKTPPPEPEAAARRSSANRMQWLNFGALFRKKAEQSVQSPGESVSLSIHLRSGDAIPGRVLAIDEMGVHISSPVAESQVIPHTRIKAAEFLARVSPPDLEAAKKERLLTIPRKQKASPPTHLLCARNGDLLRCRLISLDERTVCIELQLAEIELPRDRIAQIIWFHPEESGGAGSDDASDSDERPDEPSLPVTASVDGQVQVVQSNGNRVTFHPEEVDGESIAGTSEILGTCRFHLKEIDQMLFGRQVETEVAELAYHQWRLQPAVEPLVAQDFEETGRSAGTISPLVGQPAPEIDLELLGGGRFRLSECQGQIVVLDFWASWCGPCMQTMPLVEQAMQEFDPDRVRMISVNLEEPAEEIEAVLQRHQLGVTVALDIDGVAAARYEANAIPQLVVVDRDGRIARLYVGGGRNVVEQFKLAIDELLSNE